MATHYHGSRGSIPIADMNPHHLRSAHAKLVRERTNEARDPEIAAMAERLSLLDAEYEAEAASRPGAA